MVLTGGAVVKLRISSHLNIITNSYTGKTEEKPGIRSFFLHGRSTLDLFNLCLINVTTSAIKLKLNAKNYASR